MCPESDKNEKNKAIRCILRFFIFYIKKNK